MRSGDVLVLRVAREKVVAAARSAIVSARRRGAEISSADARRLLRVARSAPEFALGNWYVDGRCGCLVGNLLGGADAPSEVRLARQRAMGNSLYQVGLRFDADIRSLLTSRQLALVGDQGAAVLRVVD